MAIATTHIYADDPNGIRRLIAAPGDVIPEGPVPSRGIVMERRQTVVAEPLVGYDAMSEADVVARLPTLAPAELARVQDYEAARLARGSITNYGQQSQVVVKPQPAAAPEPVPVPTTVPAVSAAHGYEALSPEQLDAEITRRGLDVRANASVASKIKALQKHDAVEQES